MIIGTGIDIVELDRIHQLVGKQGKFIDRILTEKEKQFFFKLSDRRKIEFLAGRFAAKEAFSKAAGTGIGHTYNFTDIEVLPNENGKPLIVKPTNFLAHLSISHSKDYAVAQVILESLSS